MGSASFPRTIAGLITEDPDEVKEGPEESDPNKTSKSAKKEHTWPDESHLEFEELALGDSWYSGMMVVGGEFSEGEEEVRYHRDGSGTPGTPSYWDWEIVDVYDVNYTSEHEEGEADLTDELKQKLIDSLNKSFEGNDDQMQELLGDDHPGPDPADHGDTLRDRMKDEGY